MGQNRSDAGQFEWVNAWAESAQPAADPAVATAPAAIAAAPPKLETIAAPVPRPFRTARATLPDDQLMRDIAEIERVRDALAAMPIATLAKRTQALTLVPSRTTDPVPVVVGGVLALVMLTVFGAAAAMTKLAR